MEIEGVGYVKTKAIVAYKETDMSYYILGNEIQKLIDEMKRNNPKILNAVLTRSHAKADLKSQDLKNKSKGDRGVDLSNGGDISAEIPSIQQEIASREKNGDSEKSDENQVLTDFEDDLSSALGKTGRVDFQRAQQSDESLDEVRKKAEKKKSH